MWPFKKRVYDPNAPAMKLELVPVVAVILLSFVLVWAISSVFKIGNLGPVGPVIMLVIFAVMAIMALAIVKARWEGREVSNKDYILVIMLMALLILGYTYLPTLAPDLFAQSIISIKTQGLNAFVNPIN